MQIDATQIDGVFVVEVEPIEDERGLFARTFGIDEFDAAGIDARVAQCSVSYNHAAATLRGMHFQNGPYGETKLVRCIRGRIFDVAVDARSGSSTFGQWQAWELNESNRRALLVPPGVAHGFITLAPRSEVFYQISVAYREDASAGLRWDDPQIAIQWPMPPAVISERDRRLPMLADIVAQPPA